MAREQMKQEHAGRISKRVGAQRFSGSAMVHELKVIKTDAAPGQLPYDEGSAKAKEDSKVGGLENIAGGGSRKLVLDLAPGKYVLICNVAAHYLLGMRAAIDVK